MTEFRGENRIFHILVNLVSRQREDCLIRGSKSKESEYLEESESDDNSDGSEILEDKPSRLKISDFEWVVKD